MKVVTFHPLFLVVVLFVSGCESDQLPATASPTPRTLPTSVQPVVPSPLPTLSTPTPTVVANVPDSRRLAQSVSAGINFLHQSQLPYGEFKTYACSNEEMTSDCHFDSSPFVTTFVLYSLSFGDDPRIKEMTDSAIQFFLDEMDSRGLWKYWTSRNERNIVPDLDDTACVSHVLMSHGIPFRSNADLILANRDGQGKFYTWIQEPNRKNDIDCVVNANVLLYLGENQGTGDTCQYLNSVVSGGLEDRCSPYYPDKISFYYMLSRAYFNGVSCLGASRDSVVERVILMQQDNGSFGDEFSTALAIGTLLNLHDHNPRVSKAIEYLLDKQTKDGSWSRSLFFVGPAPSPYLYFGSEELTTALCIEALSRYWVFSQQ